MNKSNKMSFPTINGFDIIQLSQISYVKSMNNYCKLITTNNEEIFITKSLKHIEEKLQNHAYYRVHKCYLVNIENIKKYIKKGSGSLVLSCNSTIPIGKEKKNDLVAMLTNIK